MKNKIFAVCFALMLILSLTVSVFASNNRNVGSISVTMQYRGETVPGGTLTLYYVAAPGNGAYYYGSSSFSGCGYSLANIYSNSLADNLASYANSKSIEGATVIIDENGKATFTALQEGLYLIVQNMAAEGYNEVNPFLVTIPNAGKYNVDATPKLDILTKPTPEEPDEPEESDSEEIDDGDTPKDESTDKPTSEVEETLPQTGQLNWPVPVMAVSGLVLFAFGWCMRRADNRE